MNGIMLIVPFIFVRFSLLNYFNKDAVKRAALFAPTIGKEQYAYIIYQITNIAIFVYLCFLEVIIESSWMFYISICIYVIGIGLCALSIKDFAKPATNGLNVNGIYRYSRNPMYVSYFIYFVGCALLTKSLILGIIILVFQISAHWIILSEERWCIKQFKDEYKQYMKKVRRYL